MPLIPSLFERVPSDKFEPSAGSPAVEDDFRGILLAAPTRVILADGVTFPVCGTYRVSGRFFNRFTSFVNEIVVVAVDTSTHAPRVTNLLREGLEPVGSGFDPSAPDFEQIVITGWFNIDLFTRMPSLPRAAGGYTVFATVGDVVSNALTVEIVAP
jgi:hypothetical protein